MYKSGPSVTNISSRYGSQSDDNAYVYNEILYSLNLFRSKSIVQESLYSYSFHKLRAKHS